ncbi:hypothetical protein Bhyg_05388 [Pseudolycoriella hygida]|uniref:Transposable element P transposase-like RNase H C-terminal domain-containing protein n=1 Tax=Pseudolycoriella hygida TaxID=35572 RepID=A0A9Q0NH02_9DIPT|nr:hypothetical protein Bhyg_05388 [Pseudolycoriella hygida]
MYRFHSEKCDYTQNNSYKFGKGKLGYSKRHLLRKTAIKSYSLIELLRSKGGFNNNPNCVQFKATFKRLLMRNELTSSLNANCLNSSENVLDVWEDAFDEANTLPLTDYAADVVTYIAGFVERSIKKQLKCVQCVRAISTTDFHISKLIEIKNHCATNQYRCDLIMRQFVDKPVFRNMDHSCRSTESDHSMSLIKSIINTYLNVRLHHIAKHHNINSKKNIYDRSAPNLFTLHISDV